MGGISSSAERLLASCSKEWVECNFL